MILLILGLVLFIGTHSLAANRGLRADLILRIGEGPYRALFSLLSLAGVVLMAVGFSHYRQDGYIQIWTPPVWTRHLAPLLMWPAMICLVAAYVPGNIKRVLKHPMLVAVKIWASAHLLANGDLGSIILFGSILAWAVYDRISLKRREATGEVKIAYGGRLNDVVAVLVGTALFVAVGLLHPLLFGVQAFPV